MSLSKRQRYEKRFAELKQARVGFEPAMRDILDQLIPWRNRINFTGTKGNILDRHLYNSRPRLALRALAAMIMAGMTSPARQWFGLTIGDTDLAQFKPVRQHLEQRRDAVAAALQVSNFYKAISSATYLDLPSVCTSHLMEEEPTAGLIRFMDSPPGQYWIDCNADGVVDTSFRSFRFNSRQAVAKFGKDNCSARIRNAYDQGNYATEFEVVHAVQPIEPDEYRHGAIGRHGMRFSSCWFEQGASEKEFLREGGYHEFPALTPRWSSMPDTAYGYGPGWDVRADCRMLQHLELRKIDMIDKVVDPPLRERGLTKAASLLPGAVSSLGAGQDSVLEPLMTINPSAIGIISERIQETEAIIAETFYGQLNNLFMQDDRAQPRTATEIDAKRGEQALQMGPLLESMNDEFLEPLIERTDAILQRNGMMPEPPPELDGVDVKIEFISIMHQMQQSSGLGPVQLFLRELAFIHSLYPQIVDKIDFGEMVDEIQRITGVRADAVLDKIEYGEIQQRRAQAQQAQEQGMAMMAMAQGANQLGSADPQNLQQNVQQLAGAFSPVVQAQGGAAA